MPHFLQDGSVMSSHLKVGRRRTPDEKRYKNYSTVRARVDEVLYTDDNRNSTYNTSYKQVEYICTIISGPETGKKLFNVISTSPFGGVNNTGEIIHNGMSTKDKSGTDPKSPNETSGDIVLLNRTQGFADSGVIIGCLKHPKTSSGATKADGQRVLFEFNGMQVSMGKDGGVSITNTGGPKDENGNPTNAAAGGSAISLGSDGSMSMAKGEQKISMDGTGQVSIVGPGGTEMNMNTGGATEMKAQTTSMKSDQALNIKSTLTSIGQGGTPGARVGDVCVGTGNQGFPVVSKIVAGSYINMVGS
jgi:hypothetical protein